MSEPIADHLRQHFLNQLDQLIEAGSLTQAEESKKLASTIDPILNDPEGPEWIYTYITKIQSAGFFEHTSWNDPTALNSSLVGGTLKSGGLNTVYEAVSELRIAAAAEGKITLPGFGKKTARKFLEEVMVTNLDLLFPDASEEQRNVDEESRIKAKHLFDFLMNRAADPQGIQEKMADELDMICAQRPIVADRARQMIFLIKKQVSANELENLNPRLKVYLNAIYAPSKHSADRTPEQYRDWLEQGADSGVIRSECKELAVLLRKTGLSSAYHALMLTHVKSDKNLIALLLELNAHGKAELGAHGSIVTELIEKACLPLTSRFVYGLACLLERGLLSRQPVHSGLRRLMGLNIHPEMEKAVRDSRPDTDYPAIRHILADTVCLLGQPLGVGQGWNPTCQSARGMSIWSRHAPGKVLEMIITAASANNLEMRFEGQLLKSSQLAKGLAQEFDYNLDAASVVLVPHLDRIYNEMMNRASGRGEDPHKWVNPAMYGHWIPTGFITPYNYLTNTISYFERFIRLFYATHHPEFNGGRDLTYPNPVGIFLTASTGKLLGFHAVSILRVRKFRNEYRVYFLNPNNEGRQKWQSDIQPTVAGNGEEPGESSLPFHQFASRIYAFHYHPGEADGLNDVDDAEIGRVIEIAKESWGKSYTWQDYPEPSMPVFLQ